MKQIRFKITQSLLNRVRGDLYRRHSFAAERVGFIACKVGAIENGAVILAHDYFPVADEDYVEDWSVGAMMGSGAIRKALQIAYHTPLSMFHVHSHGGNGQPRFSRIDLRETAKFVPDFWKVRPEMPHGAIVLSDTHGTGLCWYPSQQTPIPVSKVIVVGTRLTVI